MTILFENDFCVAVDKPAGWLSVPGRTADDQRPILGIELGKTLKKQIFPIHRLDAEVSGVILYGKTAEFHRAMNVLFENKAVRKTYQAFSEPTSMETNVKREWKSKLERGKKRAYEADFGKLAITEAIAFPRQEKYQEWNLFPLTGRSHQLRFEMYKHQCPIIGDELYGSKIPWTEGIALRAIALELPSEVAEKWKLPQKLSASPLVFQ